jgi:predicted kinase
MTIVHLMQGLPASGKTTFARTLDTMRFSLDDYRAMMWNTEWSKEKEHVAVRALIGSATEAIKLSRDIVIDNTHLSPSTPKLYRKEFARLCVTFEVHSFASVSINECIARDSMRAASVGEDVIRRLAANYEKASKNGWRLTDKWMNGEPYTPPEPYVVDSSLPSIVIVDNRRGP